MGELIMSKIINLEEIRLSMQDHDELIVTAIEKSAEQINLHVTLITDLKKRVEELEENVKERENEIDDIFRVLEAT
jgi:phosphate uptake regulator